MKSAHVQAASPKYTKNSEEKEDIEKPISKRIAALELYKTNHKTTQTLKLTIILIVITALLAIISKTLTASILLLSLIYYVLQYKKIEGQNNYLKNKYDIR